MKTLTILLLLSLLFSCTSTPESGQENMANNQLTKPVPVGAAKAVFAGGCFWCMEPPFEKLPGVYQVLSGYSGGEKINPTYSEVSGYKTKHLEVVEVSYDPDLVSYNDLLEVFWRSFDPTDAGGSFFDRGHQYTSAIFYSTPEEKSIAEASKKKLQMSGRFEKDIVTPIIPAKTFYPAEEYHQDFYKKSTIRYKSYRKGSGRDRFIEKHWGKDKVYQPKTSFIKPSKEALKKQLSDIEYRVTQENGTERPFKNKYWDNKENGIYVDIVSGEPLFSSKDKFKSGTGWPSFTKPLVSKNVIDVVDNTYGMRRVEVRSKLADSHLGHLFKDGPVPTGLRYCINSASLKFISKDEMKKSSRYRKYLDQI